MTAWGASQEMEDCSTSQEFVATMEFLRDRKDLAVPEIHARKLAERVAQGCSGAAARFIKVTSVLSRSGLGSRDSAELGLDMALRSDVDTETFLVLFKKSFLRENLDLDARSSVKIALDLSKSFRGDLTAVRDDFERLVDFCVSSKSLDLPKPRCAAFAARVASIGEKWQGKVAKSFIELFQFLRSEEGVGLATFQALPLAEEIVSFGARSVENFTHAYVYATRRGGLSFPRRDALSFARRLASQSTRQLAVKTEESALVREPSSSSPVR